MAGRLREKVAFVTGAARGQGRSHAVRLAEEGADIIAVDLCGQVNTVPYPMSTPEDLAETVHQVEAVGRSIIASQADVRDLGALERAVAVGVAELGRLDIVVANAGISTIGSGAEMSEQTWQDMIDINLGGVWRTTKATVPHLIAAGRGGSIILSSSTAGIIGYPNIGHYVAAKRGVMGLMKTLALELGSHMIRVNTVNPTSVSTPMFHNDAFYALFAPDIEHPTRQQVADRFQTMNVLPVPWVEPVDVSNAVVFLASDEARYITGVALPVDAGAAIS